MANIPRSCTTCDFESSCNSAMNMSGCHFYGLVESKVSMMTRLKNYFGKFFK